MDEEPKVKKFKSSDGGDSKAANMMRMMGYKEGSGLGRQEQGIVEPVSLGGSSARLGLGHSSRKHAINDPSIVWDASIEEKNVEEYPEFVEASDEVRNMIEREFTHKWIFSGESLTTLRDSTEYCDSDLVNDVIEGKSVFDNLEKWVINEARKRANPYETVMGGIFQNRAAMKTANLDRVFDWRLSQEFDEQKRLAKNPINLDTEPVNTSRNDKIFYFADVCAGPGGFSEYMLWRKAFYNVKGLGFTLRGNNDFKLQNFRAGSSAFFETYYGPQKNGDVTSPENLRALEAYVKKRTDDQGCDLVMCDGGFSVEGKEEIQEILSKRLYLCQFIAGLSLVRVEDGDKPGGNYLCKLFDVFTSFSAGLVYLMYSAFRRISLHKPNTSRPANSERYIFCESLTKFGATFIKNYLIHINDTIDKMSRDSTILEVVPDDFIKADSVFYNYFKSHNEQFARKQIIYLNKYKEFSRNKGAFDTEQANLREKCLRYWEVPDKPRSKACHGEPAHLALKSLLGKRVFMHDQLAPFTLQDAEFAQIEKQIRIRELCAVLMPEYTALMLLLSNERGEAFIYRSENSSERLEDLRLPPKTLLLVQETSIYRNNSGEIEAYNGRSKILFIVDSCRLNNDNISSLPYESRLLAIQKFCTTVNRSMESISTDRRMVPQPVQPGARRKSDVPPEVVPSDQKVLSYYLHCAEALELASLESKFADHHIAFYKPKCLQLAVQKFNFPINLSTEDDKNLLLPCQAVRFVERYTEKFVLCWSNSNQRFFIFNRSSPTANFGINDSMICSFFDHLPAPCQNNQRLRKDLVYTWSWKINSRTGYGPKAILKDEEFPDSLTAQSLCAAIQRRQNEYPAEVMTSRVL